MLPAEATGWGVVGAIVVMLLTAFFKRWVIPAPTIRVERELQDKINKMHADAAVLERARADAMQEDVMRAMAELTDALRRSRPVGA